MSLDQVGVLSLECPLYAGFTLFWRKLFHFKVPDVELINWFNLFTGGLLIALPREQAAAFCKDIEKQEGYQAWIIGIVEKGTRSARIIDKPRVIEVPAKEKDGELW